MEKSKKRKLKIFGLVALIGLIATVVYAHTTTTTISRLLLIHPDFGYEGGTGLHTKIRDLYTKIGDNLNSRYEEFDDIANSTTETHTHNFNVAFSDLRIALYSGISSAKTRIHDPAGNGWVIEPGTSALTELDITTPSSGGPHDFTVVVEMAHEYYEDTFNATTDWGSASGGYYTITVDSDDHLKGTRPMIQLFQLIGSDYEEVDVEDVTVNSSGDIAFRVLETPNGRFEGKILIK